MNAATPTQELPCELILGPVWGLYLACYTVAQPDGVIGYAKLCRHRPASVWETPGALRKLASAPQGSAEDALRVVADAACALLASYAAPRRPRGMRGLRAGPAGNGCGVSLPA